MTSPPKGPIPHASTLLATIRDRRARRGRLLVALDFDGTLAPIVERPGEAALDGAARAALARLAHRTDTHVALVSGRGLADLRARVRVPGAYYAGNHGLEIEGPGLREVHAIAAAGRPHVERILTEAAPRLAAIPGVEIEDKGLTASVHYRRAPGAGDEVAAILDEVHGGDPAVRLTRGKMVIEVRPAVDWHKGAATAFLIRTLAAGSLASLPAIFIGDDVTDEDAFRELRDESGGIIVADPPPPATAAAAFLRDISDVAAFLAVLAR